MTDHSMTSDELLGRLEGIQQHLEELEGNNYPFFHLPNLFEADPLAEPPYTVSSSFIPEEIGGNIRVIHRDAERGEYEPLDTENKNQMLSSYLPGGYKRRWKSFRTTWQGAWDVVPERPGTADIDPMFAFGKTYNLDDIVGTKREDYTGLDLPTEDVMVYVPRVLYVEQLPHKTTYKWHKEYETIFADHDPPGRTLSLGRSDPTTNYLWFRHFLDEPTGDRTPINGSSVIEGYRFEPDTEFLRCYYASLLTIYEKEDNKTLSKILTYEHGGDETTAFVAANEQSQLLMFDLDRTRMRSQAARVFNERPDIKRDVQFSLLYREVWDELFFNEGIIKNEFAVEPFVNHLIGADYWCRISEEYDAESVFELSSSQLETTLETLLAPGENGDSGRLTLMGYEDARNSRVLEAVRGHDETVESILETCQQRDSLLDFAEEVLVHSVEHALSTWATDETPAGGSFELWYDVNFQQREDQIARTGIYDSIQGGAGIATEVHDYLQSSSPNDLDNGLAAQGACHTAASDRIVLELLNGDDGEVLYDLYTDRETVSSRSASSDNEDDEPDGATSSGFESRLLSARNEVLGEQADAYNLDDLTSHTKHRIRSLFETRDTARFYAYVADEYDTIKAELGRTPRSVDMLLHLDREFIRNPQVRDTYRRFKQGTNQRDISELGERLEELTVQCITACPDCLETRGTNCVHGMKYQSKLLDRRLLTEVCSY